MILSRGIRTSVPHTLVLLLFLSTVKHAVCQEAGDDPSPPPAQSSDSGSVPQEQSSTSLPGDTLSTSAATSPAALSTVSQPPEVSLPEVLGSPLPQPSTPRPVLTATIRHSLPEGSVGSSTTSSRPDLMTTIRHSLSEGSVGSSTTSSRPDLATRIEPFVPENSGGSAATTSRPILATRIEILPPEGSAGSSSTTPRPILEMLTPPLITFSHVVLPSSVRPPVAEEQDSSAPGVQPPSTPETPHDPSSPSSAVVTTSPAPTTEFRPRVVPETLVILPPTLDPIPVFLTLPPQIFMDPYTPFSYWEIRDKNFTEQMIWYHKYQCRDTCVFGGERGQDCAICLCDEACHVTGDCCPKIFLKNPEVVPERPSCPPLVRNKDSFYMVTSCLPDLDVTEDASRCKSPNLEWRQQLPVSDVQTQITYRNKYCALCNNVSNYTPWEMALDCSKGQPEVAASSSSPEQLYWMTVQDEICNLTFHAPAGVAVRPCTPIQEPFISSCNVTGQWVVFDERIERACASFTAPISNFRNVFCRLCNMHIRWRIPGGQVVPGRVSLTAVLNLQDGPVESERPALRSPQAKLRNVTCNSPSFLDPASGRCRAAGCAAGKQWRQGRCHSVLATSNFLKYSFQADVALTAPLAHLHQISDYLRLVSNRLADTLRGEMDLFVLRMTVGVLSVSCGEDATLRATSTWHLLPRSSLPVDSLQDSLLAMFNSDKPLRDPSGNFSSQWKLVKEDPISRPGPPSVSGCAKHNFTADDVRSVYGELDGLPHDYIYVTNRILEVRLSPLLTCRQVSLEPQEYLHHLENGTLQILATNLTVDYPSFSLTNDTATVCLSSYLDGFSSPQTDGPDVGIKNNSLTSQGSTTAGIVSLSCSVLSLTLLAVTFVTYLALKELRTISGVCTMCMVGVLFLAQAVFEFGAEQTEVAGLCVALGVLAHYLWLSATFWMNACTFLMFYKLMFPLKARVYLMSKAKVVSISCLYAFLSPALIVSSAMAANYFLSGDLGYGGATCYIKRAATRRFALALPIGALVLLNLCLFVSVVIRLRRGSNIPSSKESKIGLFACAKLSVITGLTWVLLFLYEAFRYPAMEYIAIVLFGLIGVAVFVGLVLNKQVIGLVQARLRGGGDSKGGSGSFHPLSESNTTSDTSASLRDSRVIVTKM